jgi:hypothetical protein
MIQLQCLGSCIPLYREILAYQIQETLFNCTLVDANLRVPAEADFLAKYSLGSLYTPVAIRLLYFIRLSPSLSKHEEWIAYPDPHFYVVKPVGPNIIHYSEAFKNL